MNDTPDDTLPRRRPSAPRKAAKAPVAVQAPAVQAILEQALHTETMVVADIAAVPESPKPAAKRRPPRKRAAKTKPLQVAEIGQAVSEPIQAPEPISPPAAAQAIVEIVATIQESVEPASGDLVDPGPAEPDDVDGNDNRAFVDPPPTDHAPPDDGHPPALDIDREPTHHHWVYLALALFLLALGFGLWGVWTTWLAGDGTSNQNAAALRASSDRLRQEVSTLRRSDQISRDANRDLERALAERDEEIAGLRADIAFYERFVGATGQRRGLSVHDLEMQVQGGDAWHFVATLTQNLNRGAVNTGRVTLSVEGTRNDRLEKLSWSSLRKQNNAPGENYSFKYFQQVEGEVMLPKDFKPLRVTVRLVPAGGSAVEQSFPWPETVRGGR
ncbi:MAG: DUF6776 family protein [Lysobacteraceae bacterium]